MNEEIGLEHLIGEVVRLHSTPNWIKWKTNTTPSVHTGKQIPHRQYTPENKYHTVSTYRKTNTTPSVHTGKQIPHRQYTPENHRNRV